MDGRWAQLNTGASSLPKPPPHASYADMLAPAPALPPEDSVDGAGTAAAGTVTDSDFWVHSVSRKDTLIGLSFKYGVAVDVIKRVNDLPTENLATVLTLRIPKAKVAAPGVRTGTQESQAAKVRRFRVTHHLDEKEARAYLEMADWDYDAATREYTTELAIELPASSPEPVPLVAARGPVSDSSVTAKLIAELPETSDSSASGAHFASSGRAADNSTTLRQRKAVASGGDAIF